MTDKMNSREKLLAVAEWLGWQEESLSYGLRSPEDAIKLYHYWQLNKELPEMADEDFDDEDDDISKYRVEALGYDPMYDKNPDNSWFEE